MSAAPPARPPLTSERPFPQDPAYDAAVARLQKRYAALPPGSPVRLAKRTSNLFRTRTDIAGPRLDVSEFVGVLGVDPVSRTADVLGMTTYEHLVDATLAHGLVPLVVPQLKTITLGGAVSGLGIESASFRNGLPHESVLAVDVLTGDGRVVTATPDGPHADLFFGFPNSYGTLGYALRLRIELEPVLPFVRLEHRRFSDPEACFAAMSEVCAGDASDGPGGQRRDRPHFVDATAFSPGELYLTVGTYAQASSTRAGPSGYTGQHIYYRSLQQRGEDLLTVRDYVWRWDTDWFWCSRAFGVQVPWVRRMVPKRYLRSEVYWRIMAFERRHGVARRVDRWRGRPPRDDVVQDIPVPAERAARFYRAVHDATAIAPIWACPLRQRDPSRRWGLHLVEPRALYVNLGFWSSVQRRPGEPAGACDRRIEQIAAAHGGRKSLYSTARFPEDEFWTLVDRDAYERLKAAYDPGGRLLDLYAKCVQGR